MSSRPRVQTERSDGPRKPGAHYMDTVERQALTARSRRGHVRQDWPNSPGNPDLLAGITASIELAFAFYDSDPHRRRRLTDYVAGCVAEDLQAKYELSPLRESPLSEQQEAFYLHLQH